MNKCLVLCKLKLGDEKHNAGVWVIVDKTEEDATIAALGERFIFSFELNEVDDEAFLKQV